MKANVRKIRKQRRYSKEFKRKLVKDFEDGKHSRTPYVDTLKYVA